MIVCLINLFLFQELRVEIFKFLALWKIVQNWWRFPLNLDVLVKNDVLQSLIWYSTNHLYLDRQVCGFVNNGIVTILHYTEDYRFPTCILVLVLHFCLLLGSPLFASLCWLFVNRFLKSCLSLCYFEGTHASALFFESFCREVCEHAVKTNQVQ